MSGLAAGIVAAASIGLEIPFEFPFSITKAVELQDPPADPATSKDPNAKVQKGDWIVEGFAATTHLDLQDDEIEVQAFEGAAADLLKNSTVLFNHMDGLAVGKVLESRPARDQDGAGAAGGESGLWIQVRVSKSEPNLWLKIREGVINKFSIRGKVLDAAKKWNEGLKKWIKVIRKMTLVEVSFVAVPANPEAKALRWYVAKALNDHFSKNGGDLPQTGVAPVSEGSMSTPTTSAATPTPTTPAAPPPASPAGAPSTSALATATAPEEIALSLQEGDKTITLKLKGAVEQLMATEEKADAQDKDGRRKALGEIQALVLKLESGKAPAPLVPIAVGPLADRIKSGIALAAKKSLFATIGALVEGLVTSETDAERKKSYGALLEILTPPAPAPESLEQALGRHAGSIDERVKGAVRAAQDFLKSGLGATNVGGAPPAPKAPEGKVISFEAFQAFTKSVSEALALAKMDKVPPAGDGTCPAGYELKAGLCHRVQPTDGPAAPDTNSGPEGTAGSATKAAAPAPAAPAPAPAAASAPAAAAPALEAQVDAVSKALEKVMSPLSKSLDELKSRLATLEKQPASIKKSLSGQEREDGKPAVDPSDENGDPAIGVRNMFREVAGGALKRSGLDVKLNKS